MTTAPDDPATELPGAPPVVDLATWQAARDELLVREKAHTRQGDALAAARRRLPMVEVEGTVEVVGRSRSWTSSRAAGSSSSTSTCGHLACFLRDGGRVFLTYSTTGRGIESANGSFGLLDLTPYGRGEAWEDIPEGRPVLGSVREGYPGEGGQACWYWRTDADGTASWGEAGRPTPQWTRPGVTPEKTLGRSGDCS